MTKDPQLKQIFPEPPMLAFKQPLNLRNMLVRAKHPSNGSTKTDRQKTGMFKCN